MYSVVLATMISVGGANAPTTWWHGCHGCYGCGGCYGCHGCYGCYGCHGYAFGCYGCCGGCYGCYGGCYGCYGGCYGCYGCCGGCYGCYGGCYGCYGGCYGGVVYVYGCSGCCGGTGGQPPPKTGGDAQAEIQKLREVIEQLKKRLESYEKKESPPVSQPSAGPARVTIQLPADAKLYIDNVACPLTSGKRSFDTPSLQPNKKYFYNVRAEVVRDGQLQTETQRVVVQSGQQVSVNFANFTPVTTSTQR
jgi:uncharacterized protein (TIGR03000 family)